MSRKRSSTSKITPKQRGFFIFIGVFLTLTAAGILWFNGRVSSLDCRRVESSQIDCAIQSRWLGLLPLEEQTVSHLQAANFERNCSVDRKQVPSQDRSLKNNRESCTYSVTLATVNGMVDLSPTLASGGNEEHKQQVVQQINTFINTPTTPSLRTVQSELGPQTVVLGLILLTGLILIGVNTRRVMAVKWQTA